MPSGSGTFKYNQEFCDRVKKETGGRLNIELFGPGTLFPDTDALEGVGQGVAEMCQSYPQFYSDTIPEAATFQLPYGIVDFISVYNMIYRQGWLDIMGPLYEQNNIHYAAYIAGGLGEQLWCKEPIRSLEDFKGLKIRMIGPAAKFFADYLGAAPVTLPGPEILTALQLGTIDAAEYAGGSMDYALGIHEVTNYRILPYWAMAVTEYLVAKDKYEALPDDLRATFDLCTNWIELYMSSSHMNDDIGAIAKMVEERGMQTMYLPDADVAELRTMAREYWETLRDISPTADKLIQIQIDWAIALGLLEE